MLTKSGGGQLSISSAGKKRGGGVTTHFLKITQFEKKRNGLILGPSQRTLEKNYAVL